MSYVQSITPLLSHGVLSARSLPSSRLINAKLRTRLLMAAWMGRVAAMGKMRTVASATAGVHGCDCVTK